MVCVLHVETKLKIRRSRCVVAVAVAVDVSGGACVVWKEQQQQQPGEHAMGARDVARPPPVHTPMAASNPYPTLCYRSPASCSAVLCNWESDANHFYAIVLHFCIDFHSSSLFTVASAAGAARPLANKSAWHLVTDIAVHIYIQCA